MPGLIRHELHWQQFIRKDGKPGRLVMVYRPYSPVQRCTRCGRFGGLRAVCHRSDVYGWNRQDRDDYTTPSLDTLCTPCWNVARPIKVMRNAIDELGRLARKLEREAQRAKQGRKDARQPAAGDRAGQERRAVA